MLAITMERAARLGSEVDAKAFLDDVATKYTASAGILLLGLAAGASGVMMMDPGAIDALTEDKRRLCNQQLELIARSLKMDLRSGEKAFIGLPEANKLLQAQIDLWNVEHREYKVSAI